MKKLTLFALLSISSVAAIANECPFNDPDPLYRYLTLHMVKWTKISQRSFEGDISCGYGWHHTMRGGWSVDHNYLPPDGNSSELDLVRHRGYWSAEQRGLPPFRTCTNLNSREALDPADCQYFPA